MVFRKMQENILLIKKHTRHFTDLKCTHLSKRMAELTKLKSKLVWRSKLKTHKERDEKKEKLGALKRNQR